MTPSQRHAWERYSDRYILPWREEPTKLGDSFPDPARPLIMEIGTGMGDATCTIAKLKPDWNYVAVELYRPGIGRMMGRLHREQIDNVRIIRHDAIELLRTMAPTASLHGLHLFFPDPWPKKRHHKRRMVSHGFAQFIAPLLEPGAYVHLVTDWEEYAHQMVAVMQEGSLFCNSHDDFAPRSAWRPETAFERKGMAAGRSIFEIVVEKR